MNDELAKKYAATVSEQIKDFTKDKSCVLYTCINLTRKTTAVGTMYEEAHKEGSAIGLCSVVQTLVYARKNS